MREGRVWPLRSPLRGSVTPGPGEITAEISSDPQTGEVSSTSQYHGPTHRRGDDVSHPDGRHPVDRRHRRVPPSHPLCHRSLADLYGYEMPLLRRPGTLDAAVPLESRPPQN